MFTLLRLLSAACMLGFLLGTLDAADLKALKVALVTDDARPGRSQAFRDWLTPLVETFTVITYSKTESPDRATLSAHDVIILDWDQRALREGDPDVSWGDHAARFPNPLGQREAWNMPTVLVGSSGLMVGFSWAVAGNRGCTCLYPLAYDIRDHPVTQGPLPIDRTALIDIPTPPSFVGEISTATIQVLPLIDGSPDQAQRARPGWCTYFHELGSMPDIEWISGGVNGKSILAGAMWRQGNLFHFGFQQSPEELNANGRNLLANAIGYIADFHDDRPIAHQSRGVFGAPYFPSRLRYEAWLRRRDEGGDIFPSLLDMLEPGERTRLAQIARDPEAFAQWIQNRLPYLYADHDAGHFMVDEQLVAWGLTYDEPAFLSRLLTELRSAMPDTALILTDRYLPCSTAIDGTAAKADWIEARQQALFPTDVGGYRWYVDELSFTRKRAVQSHRGPLRRDLPKGVCDPATGVCTPLEP